MGTLILVLVHNILTVVLPVCLVKLCLIVGVRTGIVDIIWDINTVVNPWEGMPPSYFQTKLRPEGPKKIFSRVAPPYLRVWMTAPRLSKGLDPPL